jgi:hypothetical protein
MEIHNGGHSTMVLNDLAPRFKELASLGAELNEASDDFTEELKKTEAQLRALNLGLEVEYTGRPLRAREWVSDTDPGLVGRARECCFLAYEKLLDGNWHLVVNTYSEKQALLSHGVYDDDSEYLQVSAQPLLSASRDLRIAAAEVLDGLLDAIKARVQAKLASLRKVSDRN